MKLRWICKHGNKHWFWRNCWCAWAKLRNGTLLDEILGDNHEKA